ncbi:hypothetical protein PIB30_079363 [Stylosanthes scabra]|uniref:Uncharacterized protein n=1 Tax=Stylosanthes scabra TaxID=79078 RepID=A0ABU6ZPV3_9FABA|nr:hypothetical protein [Stylosanthes scabra]
MGTDQTRQKQSNPVKNGPTEPHGSGMGNSITLQSLHVRRRSARVIKARPSSQPGPDPRKNEKRKLEEQEKRNLEHSVRAPTPRRGFSGPNQPCLGVDINA